LANFHNNFHSSIYLICILRYAGTGLTDPRKKKNCILLKSVLLDVRNLSFGYLNTYN
jgi:hypothetical protein